MKAIKCFFLEPTDRERQSLRRYASHTDGSEKCSTKVGCHDAQVLIGEAPNDDKAHEHPHDDARWPTKCEKCDYSFTEEDHWQLFTKRIYKRSDNGEESTLFDVEAGAMWHADWMPDERKGPDGHCLVVMTPGGEWMVDSRASNCTMPTDTVHRCWVKHGTPPDVTVDKNGNTCNAGGGSIQAGSFHGFLRGGYLVI
jgi:hypothetical protein